MGSPKTKASSGERRFRRATERLAEKRRGCPHEESYVDSEGASVCLECAQVLARATYERELQRAFRPGAAVEAAALVELYGMTGDAANTLLVRLAARGVVRREGKGCYVMMGGGR